MKVEVDFPLRFFPYIVGHYFFEKDTAKIHLPALQFQVIAARRLTGIDTDIETELSWAVIHELIHSFGYEHGMDGWSFV